MMHQLLNSAKQASSHLALTSLDDRNHALSLLREGLLESSATIIAANQKDLKKMKPVDPMIDRLMLNEKRIQSMANDLMTVIKLPDPLNRVLEDYTPPSGIHIKKISVPLGVIGIIYEARPNVTIDVASLCLKAGNAAVLRGGSAAYETNKALMTVIKKTLKKSSLPQDSVVLLPPDRKLLIPFLKANQYLDVIIPRGGADLIKMVRENATVPVIETGASVVHTFVDATADIAMACNIIWNEKTRRPSVCNAVDTILVHQGIAKKFLPELAQTMLPSRTVLHVDQKSYSTLKAYYAKELLIKDAEKQFATEFLSLQMNVAIVPTLDAALEHIAKYSLKHSESIVTKSRENAERFEREVDAACVYVNTSTAFSDGAQFGMGAEIGISTEKLHARGPMGLRELTSYKWIVESEGLTRK